MSITDEIIIISQTASPKNYCKYEHTLCEFANDMGYCVKTGCSKRIIINEKPTVNHNLVEVVLCKDCKHRPKGTGANHDLDFPDHVCPCQCEDDYWYSWKPKDDWFCADGERREE